MGKVVVESVDFKMTAILYRYLIVCVACVALLAGLQVPNFVDQYQKRLDAHLREVTVNLQAFQEIADKYFGGDLGKLIELHLASDAKPFQEEGAAIRKMVERKLRFETDMAALKVGLPMRALHVLLRGDPEILGEARQQYSYAVPLNRDALLFGAAAALLFLLLVELLFALARFSYAKIRRPKITSSTIPS
jgi:hypothetical protein